MGRVRFPVVSSGSDAYDFSDSLADGPVGAGLASTVPMDGPVGAGYPSFVPLDGPVGAGSDQQSRSSDVHAYPDWPEQCTSDKGDFVFNDCFKYSPDLSVNPNFLFNLTVAVFYDQRQSSDWYWSYKEDMYVRIDKFSCIDRSDIYLYPLIFQEFDELYPIVEDPASNGGSTANNVLISSSDEYLRSEQCSDEYLLAGNEQPLWEAIDKASCTGASVSEALPRNGCRLLTPSLGDAP